MPPDKAGEGKRKLPEPPESMVTPDKKIPIPTGSSGSSARRILFSKMHQELDGWTAGAGEMEEVQSRSRLCPQRDAQSGASTAPASGTHRQRARVLFGRLPGREQMNHFFESTEQQASGRRNLQAAASAVPGCRHQKVRQAFQERWGLEPNSGTVLPNGQWQWAIRGIVAGKQFEPIL